MSDKPLPRPKLRVGIAPKVIIPFVVISVLSTLILAVASFISLYSNLSSTLEESSKILTSNLGDSLADPMSMGEYDRLQKTIQLAKHSDQDVAYAHALASDGRVIASTDSSIINKLLNRNDFEKEALTISALQKRNTQQSNIFELVTPIKNAAGQAGVLRVGFTTQRVISTCGQSALLIITVGCVALLIGIVIYTALIRRAIISPIADVVSIAARFAQGDIDIVVPSSVAADEIGDLIGTFGSMARSWQEMAGVAKRVSEGDLTATIQPRSERDVFVIAFNQMIANMKTVTAQFREAVQVVASAAAEILASVNQTATGATQTATTAAETSTTVEQFRQICQAANQKARQVSDTANKTAQITATGRKATSDIITGMLRIREQVDLIGESMVKLEEKSHNISEIIAIVDVLAQQSNLLAVNAAIEASKAGEIGLGFAVVAREVKNMADISKRSTAQIRSILDEIQQAAHSAAVATEMGSRAVEDAVEQSSQAGQTISVLAGSVADSATAATQIALSSQEQLIGVDQVVDAMAGIRDACGHHLITIKQVESTVQQLTDISATLKVLVDKYEVWEGRGLARQNT